MPKFTEPNYDALENYFNILIRPREGTDLSYVVTEKGLLLAIGGTYADLYQLKDTGDFVGYRFSIDSIDGDNFIFNYVRRLSDHSEATALEVGKEMYFKKGAFFHSWLVSNESDYGQKANVNRNYMYFGKIYEYSGVNTSSATKYYVKFEGLKNWVIDALPYNNRTDRIQDFLDIAFDHVYHQVYHMTKDMFSFFDPKEVRDDHLYYIADKFNIDIDEDIDETRLREFIDNLPYIIKRKGTYAVYYAIYQMLFGNSRNKLNIYERWMEWCWNKVHGNTPVDRPGDDAFEDHHILEYYGQQPSGGAGTNWYKHYDPNYYPGGLDNVWSSPAASACASTRLVYQNPNDIRDYTGIDTNDNITQIDRFNLYIDNFNSHDGHLYLGNFGIAPSASVTNTVFEFKVKSTSVPSGGICIWAVTDEKNKTVNQWSGDWVALFSEVVDNTGKFRLKLVNQAGNVSYSSSDLYMDRYYYIYVYHRQVAFLTDRWYVNVYPNKYMRLTERIDTFYISDNTFDFDYKYISNYKKAGTKAQEVSASMDIEISNLFSGVTSVDSIGPTGYPFLSPHYKVELDLSSEPLGETYIINELYATELKRYWEYMKPVSKFVDYHFLIAPVAKIENFKEYQYLYNRSLGAYCNTVFTGSDSITASPYEYESNPSAYGVNTYTHRQSTSSNIWRIEHGLDSDSIITQLYDMNDELFYMDDVTVESNDLIEFNFIENIRGKAYIASLKNSDYSATISTPSATWGITHNLGSSGAIFDVYSLDKSEIYIPDTTTFIDKDTVTLTFSTSGVSTSTASGFVPFRKEDYVHTQNTASDTWTINHNLGAGGLIVEVWDEDYEYVYPKRVLMQTSDTLVIEFAEPISGTATLLFFPKDFDYSNVLDTLYEGGYWQMGTGETEDYDFAEADSLETPVISGSLNFDDFEITSTKIYVNFRVPKEGSYAFREIGLFDSRKSLMFFTKMSELYKPDGVYLDVYYRIEKE